MSGAVLRTLPRPRKKELLNSFEKEEAETQRYNATSQGHSAERAGIRV